MNDSRKSALEIFARDIGNTRQRSRAGITASSGEGRPSYPITVLGVIPGKRYLIVSAPTTADGSLIAVNKNMNLSCRWMNSSSAFKFEAVIVKLSFEPVPLLYLKLADRISIRAVRNMPRALASFPAVVRTPRIVTGLLMDLSVAGARMAADRTQSLHMGEDIELSFKPRILERDFLLTIYCKVAGVSENSAVDHPDIVFYGLQFNELPEHVLLVLQCCVQQCLVEENDALAHVLLDSNDITDLAD
jgi:hypothetical protein